MLKMKIYLITKKIFRIYMFLILFLIEIQINCNFIKFIIILSIIGVRYYYFRNLCITHTQNLLIY